MVFCGAYIRHYAHLRILRTPTHHHIFHTNCKNTPPTSAQGQLLVRRVADVAVGRRPKKRSLRYVNEHFSVKPNFAVSTHISGRPNFLSEGRQMWQWVAD